MLMMTIMGWVFGWKMALDEDIAAMELVCQRMRGLLVKANPIAYYVNDAQALIRRHPDGREEVVIARVASYDPNDRGE